jgi:hypothetical protein
LQIDFQAVAQATNIKPPAARMRYSRLRRQIEDGTLIKTHGTAFSTLNNKKSIASNQRAVSKKRHIPFDEVVKDKHTMRSIKRGKVIGEDMKSTASPKSKEKRIKERRVVKGENSDYSISSLPFLTDDDKNRLSLSKLRRLKSSSALPQISTRLSQPLGSTSIPPPPFQLSISRPLQNSARRSMTDGREVCSDGRVRSDSRYPEVGIGKGEATPPFKSANPMDSINSSARPWAPGAWGLEEHRFKEDL